MAYTSGPWERVDTPDYAEIHPEGERHQSPIALVGAPDNANLVAAAPELLDHLRSRCADLRAALDCKSWVWDGDQRDCAEIEYASSMALIAKATGTP